MVLGRSHSLPAPESRAPIHVSHSQLQANLSAAAISDAIAAKARAARSVYLAPVPALATASSRAPPFACTGTRIVKRRQATGAVAQNI